MDTDTSINSIADGFQKLADEVTIDGEAWATNASFSDFSALLRHPPSFGYMDMFDINTHARLVIEDQPPPYHVAYAHTAIGEFQLKLVPHPLMPANALSTWEVSNLKVALLGVGTPPSQQQPAQKTKDEKKKRRVNSKSSNASLQHEFRFNKQLETTVSGITLASTLLEQVRLEFSCTATDPLFRSTVFVAHSDPFTVISNCNQWHVAIGSRLHDFIFPAASQLSVGDDNIGVAQQAPFSRLFNHLHLAYLATKGFEESRYLDPYEIRSWLVDYINAQPPLLLAHDKKLLCSENIVTEALFNTWWAESAGIVFYDLHTANVGKLFQKLWLGGFVGVGICGNHGQAFDVAFAPKGHARLAINTQKSIRDDKLESYLLLQTRDVVYPLLGLERDHLAYFFEHSRHSMSCTHLISVTVPGETLDVSTLFAVKK